MDSSKSVKQELNSHYLGIALVSLHNFTREPRDTYGVRSVSEANVASLVRVFELDGCKPRLYPVDAVIDASAWHQAQADNMDSSLYEDLHLPRESKVTCIHGLHRILAASRYLDPSEAYWFAHLYDRALSDAALEFLRAGDSKATEFSDGDIYRYWRGAALHGSGKEDAWLAELTTSKRADLQQLKNAAEPLPPCEHQRRSREDGRRSQEHQRLMEALLLALDRLLPFIGLWAGFKIGCLHRCLTLRCPEELINYLGVVYECWSYIAGKHPYAVDLTTVKQLEGRIPYLSQADADFVHKELKHRLIFRHVTDDSERTQIETAIFSLARRIPSLHTFLEDTKYLEPGAHILRTLVPRDYEVSIQRAFEQCFVDDRPVIEQHGGELSLPISKTEGRRRAGYIVIWLFGLGNFRELTGDLPRKDKGRPKPVSQGRSPEACYRLARLARRCGFKSDQIRALASQDPDQQMCEDLLLRACPSAGYASRWERLLQDVAPFVEKLKHLKNCKPPHHEPPMELPSLHWSLPAKFSLAERCGRPFEAAFNRDCRHLVIDYLYHTPWESNPPRGPEVSSFAVHREIFRAFFGVVPEDEDMETQSDVPNPPSPGSTDNNGDIAPPPAVDLAVVQAKAQPTRMEIDLPDTTQQEVAILETSVALLTPLQRGEVSLRAEANNSLVNTIARTSLYWRRTVKPQSYHQLHIDENRLISLFLGHKGPASRDKPYLVIMLESNEFLLRSREDRLSIMNLGTPEQTWVGINKNGESTFVFPDDFGGQEVIILPRNPPRLPDTISPSDNVLGSLELYFFTEQESEAVDDEL